MTTKLSYEIAAEKLINADLEHLNEEDMIELQNTCQEVYLRWTEELIENFIFAAKKLSDMHSEPKKVIKEKEELALSNFIDSIKEFHYYEQIHAFQVDLDKIIELSTKYNKFLLCTPGIEPSIVFIPSCVELEEIVESNDNE